MGNGFTVSQMGWVRGHAEMVRLPRSVLARALTCANDVIPAPKHIPTFLGTSKKTPKNKRKLCPCSWFSMKLKPRECAEKPSDIQAIQSQKATGWECDTLGLQSESVCVCEQCDFPVSTIRVEAA